MLETDYPADLRGVQALDYSPDGRYLAAGGGANWVHIWALTDDAELLRASYEHGRHSSPGVGNPMGIIAVEWSPDSRTLASAGYDAMIKLFPVKMGSDAYTLRQGGWYVLWLRWSADSARLFAGGHSSEVWDVGSGEQLTTPCDEFSAVSLGLSPDEHYLLIDNHKNNSTYLCDVITGEHHPFSPLHGVLDWNPVYPVAAGLGYGARQQITLFDPLTVDAATGEGIVAVIPVDANVLTAVWSPDGRYLAIGLEDGTVQVWELAF